MTHRIVLATCVLSLAFVGCASSGGTTSSEDVTVGSDGAGALDVDSGAADTVVDAPMDDTSTAPPDAGGSDGAADAGAVTADADDGGAADAAVTEDVPEIVLPTDGNCLNPTDEAALAGFDAEADMMGLFMGCYNMAGGPGQTQGEDVVECIVEELSAEPHNFTAPCATCMAENILCLQANCMDHCMSMMQPGADPGPCNECMEVSGCSAELYECSGLPADMLSL